MEYERISKGQMLPPVCMKKYCMEEPMDVKSIPEWKRCVDEINMHMEYQQGEYEENNYRFINISFKKETMNRIMNLECMQKFGAKVWQANNAITEGRVLTYAHEQKKVQEVCIGINMCRKRDQALNADKMSKLARKRKELEKSNMDIQVACLAIESDVKKMKTQMEST